MKLRPQVRSFFGSILKRSKAESEMDTELRFHIESYASDLNRAGIPHEEAERRARMAFGSVESFKAECRGSLGLRLWDELCADVRYGVRAMRRTPGFTLVTVLTLALGIGANSAIFGIVYGLLYRPLPFPDENRIAAVHMSFAPQDNAKGNLSIADFVDWKYGNRVFEQVAAYSPSRFALTGGDQAEEVTGALITADFFSILGIRPVLGRVFRAGDDSGTGANLVVISASLWQRRFGSSPDVVGRVIEVNGSAATIAGVVREGFEFPRGHVELWQNLRLNVTRRGPFFFQGIGRLRPGATIASAQAETAAVANRIERANPHVYSRLTMPVEPLRNFLVGDFRPALFMIFGAVLMVLLIGTVNIANLMLARGTTREREMAVRLSLGAARSRLIKQLLTESVLLALAGAAAGWFLAYAGIRSFRAFNPAGLPLAYQVRLDGGALLFTLLITVGVAVLFGLVPARQSARSDLQSVLKQGERGGSAGSAHNRTRSVLVVAEIGLSLVLLITAGLLLRSFLLLQKVNVGTSGPPENVLTMVISPKALGRGPGASAGEKRAIRFYDRVLSHVSRLPGVEHAAISDSLPPDLEGEDDTFSIAGREWTPQAFPSTTVPKISPDFFRALGVPLLRGRFFSESDTAESLPVTIISESLARRYFPNSNPLGQRIRESAPAADNSAPFMEIVGVVGDLKYWNLESEARPAYYCPYTQDLTSTLYLVVRASTPASNLASAIEREIHAEDRDAVVRPARTMDRLLGESVAQPRFRTLLLGGFGCLALILAAVGVYGVMAYSVSQRTREIGIRMALGAKRGDVLRMVIGNAAVMVVCGIAIGLIGSFTAKRLLARFLFSIGAGDPLTLAGSCSLLAGVALAATLIPAVRATRIDPQIALRHE